jgi:hypothetical protein
LHIHGVFWNCPVAWIFFCSFLPTHLFILFFNLGSFYWHSFKLIDSYLSYAPSADEPIKGILYFCDSFLFLPFPFNYEEIPSFCVYHPSFFLMLSTFSFRSLTILIS